jgi:hypothetical protein
VVALRGSGAVFAEDSIGWETPAPWSIGLKQLAAVENGTTQKPPSKQRDAAKNQISMRYVRLKKRLIKFGQ